MNKQMKHCKNCLIIKPIDDFYKAGKSHQSRCKPCHIIHRRELRQAKPKKVRGNGFQALTEDTRVDILTHLDTLPLTKLATKFGLNPNTLRSWKTRGHLV